MDTMKGLQADDALLNFDFLELLTEKNKLQSELEQHRRSSARKVAELERFLQVRP